MNKHLFDPRTERCLACGCDRAGAPAACAGVVEYRTVLDLRGAAPIWWTIPRLMPTPVL